MDAAAMMRYASKVIIVPGYGMAVGAQHKVWRCPNLEEAGVEVVFAIHPVAGRMPGHMNVLLAEAGVPYEKIFDLEEINADFAQADVALVIGANDVVNPLGAHRQVEPDLRHADPQRRHGAERDRREARQGTGYSGIENALFYKDNTRLLYGSAQQAIGR